MQFADEGYIINIKKHKESSLILTVLTREHGKLIGYANHCLSKKSLPVFQLGNLVKLDAYARLEENMLSFRVELISPTAVNFITNAKKLSALSSFCALCNSCLPEKEPLERFYYYVDSFIQLVNEDNWITHYSYFEFYLIHHLGVGLDLAECAATGTNENLRYVSPKTGKAVSFDAGQPYKDKLFLFPQFILSKNYYPQVFEMKDLLRMTGFFLNKNFFQTHNLKFPESRANLLASLDL